MFEHSYPKQKNGAKLLYGEKQKLRQQHENELGKTWAVSIKQVCSFSGIGVTYQRLLWIILRLYMFPVRLPNR